MKDRFLIIGGTTKAGTTSLFEYLGDHPEICKSSMKETRFFLDPAYPLSSKYRLEDGIEKYYEYFSSCGQGTVKLEATPDYLYCSKAASNIKSALPDAKLLFILREPVSRLVSWYNFSKQIGELPNSISLEQYVRMQVTNKGTGTKQFLRALEQGRYSEYLKEYYRLFSKDKIYIAFYEALSSDVRTLMKDICVFLEIDPRFYDLYDFRRHNQTLSIKNQLLHKLYRQYSFSIRKITHNKKLVHSTLKRIKTYIHPLYMKANSNKLRRLEIPDSLKEELDQYYHNDFKRSLENVNIRYPWVK